MLVEHQVDCFGSVQLLAIPRDNQARYQALEQRCAAEFPLCDCPTRPTTLEDGTELVPDAPDPVASGVEGQCRSRAGGALVR